MNNEIVSKYKYLILKMASKFYGESKDDLIQAGYLGLLKAYKNYSADMNVKFSTYAYEYIYGEMYETANKSKNIYINKKALRLYKKLLEAKETFSQKESRDVSFNEVCDRLNISKVLVSNILNSINSRASIDEIKEVNITKKIILMI